MPNAEGKLFAHDALPKRRDSRVNPEQPIASAATAPGKSRSRARVTALFGVLVVGAGLAAYIAQSSRMPEVEPRDEAHDTAMDVASEAVPVPPREERVANAVVEIPAPEPEKLPTAEFTFHGKKSAYGDAFYVNGLIRNTSEVDIGKPKLVVVLLDDAGNEVGSHNGYALAETLAPGEESYISAIVSKPAKHASMRFEVEARKPYYVPKLAGGLVIKTNRPVANGGIIEMSGTVENTGKDPARFVNVRVLGFDAEQKLLGISSTYAGTEKLEPGQSARFSLNVIASTPSAARYTFQVEARVAE
jgi:hypothetical protein